MLLYHDFLEKNLYLYRQLLLNLKLFECTCHSGSNRERKSHYSFNKESLIQRINKYNQLLSNRKTLKNNRIEEHI